VELDRTLGKTRVLDLYLAMAPWGQGQCGATAAAKHYFKKPVHRLTPTEAAWLASLLHGPAIELSRWAALDPQRADRTAWVLQHMRPLPAKQRAALFNELPNWAGPPLSTSPP
jgi:membrane peptidoglycan carboxypeptidase